MSISVSVDESDEVKAALEAAAGGEYELGKLVVEVAEGVTLVISFSDGESYTYSGVPADDAARIIADPSLYNSLLRGQGSSRPKGGISAGRRFLKTMLG